MAALEQHWVQQPGSRIDRVLRPTSFAEAARLLAQDPSLRVVAGGTDLVLELDRDRSGGAPVSLIDLTAVEQYRSVETITADGVTRSVLAAGVTHADVLSSPTLIEHALPLAQACLEVGSPQLRNRATVVGNLITASPANDTISALLALDAVVSTVRVVDGDLVRTEHSLQDFFTGFRSTVLEPGDVVDRLAVPHLTSSQRGIWVKAGLRKAQAISVVHAGIVIQLDDDGQVLSARVALGSVGPTVALNVAAADALVGSPLTAESIGRAASAAADSVTPISDGRASAEYRSDVIVTVISRALAALASGQERDRWLARVPVLSSRSAPAAREPRPVIESTTEIAVQVNGTSLSAPAAHSATLLDWLRETAGTGTKEGCAEGECGACTVQLDGAAVMSCLVPSAQADGAHVTTIEGLGSVDSANAMQQSFVDKFAVQCGYCIPGFVMAAQTLADEFDSPPTRDEIELALSGNLCRCTGYYNIIDAVATAMGGLQS